jgi:hypothetical protein
MGIQDFGTMDPNASLKQVIDSLADLMGTLNFLLNGNLDVKNVRAKSITADRMNVQKLSAIAADLGHITAGLIEAVKMVGSTIIGSYISTADGTYPRIDFSSANRLLTAFNSATQYVSITPSTGGTPGITWNDNGFVAALSAAASVGVLLSAFSGGITFQSSNYIGLNPTGDLEINGTAGWTGAISVTTPSGFGIISVHKGIITNFS